MAKILHIDASARGDNTSGLTSAAIHPEKLTAIATKAEKGSFAKDQILLDRESLVSWLFLIGSLMFLFDGFLELTEGISIHVAIHIIASVLFTIGSVLFIPTDGNK
ncbi:MAG: hypothetical protein QNJ53_18400 [Pleurocapsa sp. MO_192.B19]|nr:hypothetical protein [Pleurocapsa sp. MO_192.B19]